MHTYYIPVINGCLISGNILQLWSKIPMSLHSGGNRSSVSAILLKICSYRTTGIANVDITLKGQISVMDKPEFSVD